MKLPLWRRRQDRELDEELESHVRMDVADRVARGEPIEQATRAARLQFGNALLVKEVTRDMWGWTAIERVGQDARYAVRALRKTPGFAAVAVATFALGIGANTAMFSVIDAVMLRPLPFPHSERLIGVAEVDLRPGQGRATGSASWPNFFDWRARSHAFEHLSAYHESAFTIVVGGRPVHTPGVIASADLFSTLGVQPALGRAFRPDEERAGADVVIVGDALWRSELGGAPTAVGSVLTINSRPFTIIGVMPRGFRFPITAAAAQLWISAAEEARADPGDRPMTEQRSAHFLQVIGRLRPTTTLAAARAEMDEIAAGLAQEHPDEDRLRGVQLTPELERIVGETRRPLVVLLVAVGCVLLIACVNLANLLLARGATRGPEIALRLALGASRGRIVLQLLTEAVVLSMAGAAAGLLMASWAIRALAAVAPGDVRGLDELTIDGSVLAFTAAIAFVSALSFAAFPALVGSRTMPGHALAGGRATEGRVQGRIRSILVVAETAIGVVLLIAAGLLLRSFYRLANTDPGFDPSHIVTARFNLPDSRYSYGAQIDFYDRLLEDLNAQPGVEASAAAPLPLSGTRYAISFEQPGVVTARADRPSADFALVSPGFFRTLRIRLVEGREFTAADTDAAPRVLIVNQSFARQFFGGRPPIGQRVRLGLSTTEKEAPMREVVGVVADFRPRALNQPSQPAYFVPYAQGLISSLSLVVRTSGSPTAVVDPIRAILARKDPELALYDVKTLDDYVDRSVASARFQTLLLALFAALALVLTAVGVYGVVAYGVAQRVREFGVRLALGARTREVMQLVLRHAAGMAVAGVAAGVAGAAFATRLLSSTLYEVQPLDPLTFASVAATLFAVVVAAAFIPARRATQVDPLLALRSE